MEIRLSGCDIFGVKGIMYKIFKKIISGYIFDRIEKSYLLSGRRKSIDFDRLKEKLNNFLKSLHSLPKEVFKSVGEGNDIRFDSPVITGYAIEHNTKIVHSRILLSRSRKRTLFQKQKMDR